jgi:hypothetical protein
VSTIKSRLYVCRNTIDPQSSIDAGINSPERTVFARSRGKASRAARCKPSECRIVPRREWSPELHLLASIFVGPIRRELRSPKAAPLVRRAVRS